MWPQPEILPGDQRSHPPLACPNSAVSVIYCQLDRDDRLDLSPGNEQLDWWHGFCLVRSGTAPYQCDLDTKRLDTGHTEGFPLSFLKACKLVSEFHGFSPPAVSVVSCGFWTPSSQCVTSQKTQAVLKRYGAVTAERDSWGFCCALGLGASADKALRDGLKAVQCALQLMSCIGQASLQRDFATFGQRLKDADCIVCSAHQQTKAEGFLTDLAFLTPPCLQRSWPAEVRCVSGLQSLSTERSSCQWSSCTLCKA